jgi:4-oxalmesaconate hydratase
MVELDVPAMVHVSASCTPVFHATGAHYINADTTAFMQLIQGDLFADFPDLRLVIPHGGGAVPYHWGRYRGLTDMLKKPSLDTHVMKNVFFDTCVYHQPGIDLLFDVIDVDNILFGSEMVGAVRGVDPQTGHYFDDTKRYVDALDITDAAKAQVFSGNARRVYPRLDASLKAKGLYQCRRSLPTPTGSRSIRAHRSRYSRRRQARSTRTATCSARATSSPTPPSGSTRRSTQGRTSCGSCVTSSDSTAT